MNICLVHLDKHPWAAFFRAQALADAWSQDNVTIKHVSQLQSGEPYDVIHFMYSGGITRSKSFILRNKSKVFTTLASARTLDLYWDRKQDLIDVYRETICCVCHNPDLAIELKEMINQDNVVYIPNGVDEQFFNRKFVVGYVGARDSSQHKGFDLIVQACKALNLELKQPEGPREKMPDFYRSIDCLALASQSEGCNNPTLEALAMNKPVISTNVGIASELEGVFLVERNVESIIQALRKLSGRVQILERYTWKEIAKKYRDLYDKWAPL